MKFTAHFYKLNYDFSPEFADAHNNGEDSENNRKYDWEDELVITSAVEDIQVLEDSSYVLRGERDGEQFSEEIHKMTVFYIIVKDGENVPMACSKSILEQYNIEKNEGEIILNVFLQEWEPLTNPIPGLYVALQDFPKLLIN